MQNNKQRGFSLVELMVAMVIGLIVIGAASTVFIGILGANSAQMKMSRVNNELRTAMTYITRDLRRAGYQNWTMAQLAAGNFTVNPQPAVSVNAGVITAAYDLNADGSHVAADELFGFRLANNAIEASINNNWTRLTDPNVVTVTNLTTFTDVSPGNITAGGNTASVHVYAITISGTHATDASISRTMTETVRVRNVVVTAPPPPPPAS